MPSETNPENKPEAHEITEDHKETSVQKTDSSLKESNDDDTHNDFQVIETELNQHIKEAGLFYQSLGDSLRRMESAHKKIYQQHKSASTKIQQLKDKTSNAESDLSSYKKKYNSILALCFLLIIVIVAQVGYIMGGEDNAKKSEPINSTTPLTTAPIQNEPAPTQPQEEEVIAPEVKTEAPEKKVPTNNIIKEDPIAEETHEKVNSLQQPKEKSEMPATSETTLPAIIKIKPEQKINDDSKAEDITITLEKNKEEPSKTPVVADEIPEEKSKPIIKEDIQKSEEKIDDKKRIKKQKREKKAKKKLLKMIWSDYRKAISKANLILAEEKLLKIININPNDDLAHSLLKELSSPLPTETSPEKPTEEPK